MSLSTLVDGLLIDSTGRGDARPARSLLMADDNGRRPSSPRRWAELRFAIVGPLLAAPPRRGELGDALEELSRRVWRHPTTGAPVRFGASTIERWLYRARRESRDRVAVLARRVRKDHGARPSLSREVRQALGVQYRGHTGWTVQLHYDNLVALADKEPALRPLPSYSTVLRYMKAHDLIRRVRRGPRNSPGADRAAHRLETREVRSWEVEYVNQLWHSDFHTSKKLPVLIERGQWIYPVCACVLDDYSRLGCHAQWYLEESAETFVHCLGQAFLKRGLPTALMTDGGGPMKADETHQGLVGQLGVVHELTLPYSPDQNGKQESFWGQLEGRLMAMLEGVPDLRLSLLNEATQAWMEMEYNRTVHGEIGCAPLDRYIHGKDVGRPSPLPDQLRFAFMKEDRRSLRRSDGTVKLEGIRFEIPSAYRTLRRPHLRWAGWDLGHVYLVDDRSGKALARIFPVDKVRNGDGQRRLLAPVAMVPAPARSMASLSERAPAAGIPPLLEKLMAAYARPGLAPAYLPKGERPAPETEDDKP
jgi:hypothetical protein